jgi:hypothetical protein
VAQKFSIDGIFGIKKSISNESELFVFELSTIVIISGVVEASKVEARVDRHNCYENNISNKINKNFDQF